jgi:hypothetical protein
MRLGREDELALQQLTYDPGAEPAYELLKSCLVWPDERPVRISSEGYEFLGDLWAIRGFLHRELPLVRWGLDPAYFQEVWRVGLATVPNWPGFKRLQLSEKDRQYLTACVDAARSVS